MARTVTIHHPKLRRQAKVGAGFARALIRDGGWADGPLPDPPADKTTSKKKTTDKAD